ncbi:hypothetical protein [Acetilactobacillus jinshanensis]|uniref:Lipoprotein n=1 Tax=Acetilactobacillus jinshanensis TaxID=1720083 RepID=A0A4P6ZMQ9_9LACO|nr:hypothetical protein [Acetilactobacillus jinshanensis]QBP18520.1 hypothetical protein ELX58_05110 [Acetilactobacillus jinshanensis]URL61393.1 hypothetical protein HGK75_05235 [uncultured bacterium]
MKLFRKISTGIVAVLCLFTLAACQNNQQRQAAEQKKVSKEDNTLPSGNYFSDDSQNTLNNEQRKRAIHNVTNQMNNNYKKIGSVKSTGNTITLSLKGSQMQQMVQYAQQGNGQANKFWNELTDGMTKTSKTLSHQLKDKSLTLNIMSPSNKLIYSAHNGSVTTNQFK